MKKFLLLNILINISLLNIPLKAQQITEPLIIPNLYSWKLTPNGKWLSGGTSEICDIYNLEKNTFETFYGAKSGTITNSGILSMGGIGKPALLINGEVIVPESLERAISGSIQCISANGNRLCGNINYPDADIKGLYVCDIDENGIVGEPKQLPIPTLDFFGCKPQFVNILQISSDGSTIAGFVQDWRGFYCYPIIFRENEDQEWYYSFPSEPLFNPEKYPVPENPWLNEPKFPEFTDYMTSVAKTAYEEALGKYYSGFYPELPDAKDFMTEDQWNSYYQVALSYNEWYYDNEQKINSYTRDYNKILFSSVIFDLNEIAINPDGSLIGCSYIEYDNDKELAGVMKINTKTSKFQKYETDVYELYTTQILSDGTMLMSQPMVDVAPETYIILPDKKEIIDIKDFFKEKHPDYLAWINDYAGNSGTIYTNDDMTIFAGSVLATDCDRVEEITGGFYSFTYVFSPEISSVNNIKDHPENRYIVYSLNGYKILDTLNSEELKTLSKGIYVINGKIVYLK